MNIYKDAINREISIINNNEIVMKLFFVPSYFVCSISKNINVNNPIVIDEKVDKYLYSNLKWLMNQNYYFEHKYSYKNDNQLVWMSEHCFNIEDEFEINNTPRLVIDKDDEVFKIYCVRPFFEQNNIQMDSVISFAPAGNGFTSKNLDTNFSLQGDIITVFNNTLNEKEIKSKSKIKK